MTAIENYIGVTLQVRSSLLSPEQISALLERTPDATGTMGMPRGYIRGVPSQALWKTHYWCETFKDGETVEDRIRTISSVLTAKRAELESILAGNGKAAIYVYLALDASLGVVLEPDMLKVLGEMNVELGFDILGGKVPVEPSPE
jgi:hypothetical protein